MDFLSSIRKCLSLCKWNLASDGANQFACVALCCYDERQVISWELRETSLALLAEEHGDAAAAEPICTKVESLLLEGFRHRGDSVGGKMCYIQAIDHFQRPSRHQIPQRSLSTIAQRLHPFHNFLSVRPPLPHPIFALISHSPLSSPPDPISALL
jgi:hypothetical protein